MALKILLLEDNQLDINFVIHEINKKWPDAELTITKYIRDARNLINSHAVFDIALFDINLPDGNGLDFLNELRTAYNLLPVIMFTSQGSEEIATKALKIGANDYIAKKPGYYKVIPEQIEFTLKEVKQNNISFNVLYVEHIQADIDLTFLYLGKFAPQIKIHTCQKGDLALNLLPKNNSLESKYDLLLLDFKLPGLNALEIIKIVRQERKLFIPIVVVTGQGNESIAIEALKIGADDYVVKSDNYLLKLPSILISSYKKRELERQQYLLKKSETKFKLLADYASDWEYWVNPQHEYVYNSPICEKITGYKHESFVENKNLLLEITLREFKEMIQYHFSLEQFEMCSPIEFKIKSLKGEEKWISHFCRAVYDDNENYLGQRGVNRDITERKKQEEALLNALERAQESDRLKSAFLANMSHEIRTPMNGILGFSDLLRTPELSPEKQQKYINIIEKSGKRMLGTINNLMDISKIEARQMTVTISEININQKLNELFNFFKPEAENKGLKLIYNEFNSSQLIVNSDELKIYSIAMNLVKNAIKFTMAGSIEFGCIQKDDMLEFYVKDTGIGIPKDRIPYIFDRFVQADIEDKFALQGSGLGLAIAKSYAEMLGGEIKVQSEQGIGTQFYFTLPNK